MGYPTSKVGFKQSRNENGILSSFFLFFQDKENPGDLLASSRIHSSQKLIHLGPLTISSLVTHLCSAVTFDILSM